MHRPDLLTHPQETARILEDLRTSGKVLEVGVSNFTAAQTAALANYLPFPLASAQPEFSALHLDPLFDGVFDQCMAMDLTVLAWSPLGGGRLATRDEIPEALGKVLADLAAREEVDLPTIALAFVLAHPTRPVGIVGSTQVDRITAAQRALTVKLDRTDVYAIIQASMGAALP
ncbi:MAG: aldo/keto reductase [Pseudomonadota bacterium]